MGACKLGFDLSSIYPCMLPRLASMHFIRGCMGMHAHVLGLYMAVSLQESAKAYMFTHAHIRASKQ